jgi:hypothetical protein
MRSLLCNEERSRRDARGGNDDEWKIRDFAMHRPLLDRSEQRLNGEPFDGEAAVSPNE